MSPIERNEVFRKALAAYRVGRMHQAADGFRSLLDDGSNEPTHVSYCGLLELQCGGRTRHGLDLCRRALALSPDDPAVHVNLARAYRFSGRNEQARGVLRRALRVWPNHAGLCGEIERVDSRRKPPLSGLHRDHPVNKYLGKLRSRVVGPRS